MFLQWLELLRKIDYRRMSYTTFTRCTSGKCRFQTTDGAPEQFVL